MAFLCCDVPTNIFALISTYGCSSSSIYCVPVMGKTGVGEAGQFLLWRWHGGQGVAEAQEPGTGCGGAARGRCVNQELTRQRGRERTDEQWHREEVRMRGFRAAGHPRPRRPVAWRAQRGWPWEGVCSSHHGRYSWERQTSLVLASSPTGFGMHAVCLLKAPARCVCDVLLHVLIGGASSQHASPAVKGT